MKYVTMTIGALVALKRETKACLIAGLSLLLPGVAFAEEPPVTFDWTAIMGDVSDWLTTAITDVFAEFTPVILAGLSVTIGFIGFRLIKRGIRTFSS